MRPNSQPGFLRWTIVLTVAGGMCTLSTNSACAQAPAAPAPAPAPSTPALPAAPVPDDENTEREVLVTLKSGQRIQGILTAATDKAIQLKVAGINASFAIADIEQYEYLPPLMEKYRELRDSVGNNPDQIMRLSEWLRERGKYELALSEVERALAVNPDHADSLRLKRELTQQILLRARARPQTKPDPAANPQDIPGGGEVNVRRSRITDFPLLTPAQVDLIKVYEVDLSERPRVIVAREAMERLMADNVGHPLVPVTKEGRDALLRKSPIDQLDLIFRLQARELYSQVQVLDMPGSIRKFRENVQATWLMTSCATTMCHGGSDAGRLVLATRRPNHDQTVYTNLLILQKYQTRDGRPLLDWENPEKSILFQAALPRQDSLFPHPNAPLGAAGRDGWKPAFRDTSERMFLRSADWVRSAYKPRPDYNIPYVPVKPFEPPPAPKPAPATAPANGGAADGPAGDPRQGREGEPPPR